MNKTILSILKIIENQEDIIGSREISRRLKLYGIDLSERAVRYYLKLLDEQGFTEVFAKQGRRITDKGREELKLAFVSEKVGFVISKIETLSYLSSLNIETMKGQVILNTSLLPEDRLDEAIKILMPIFSSPYIMSDRIIIGRSGERIGNFEVPKGKFMIGTVCSITINGIFLKAGIPLTSRFGGVVEICDAKPKRFISLISYEGSSLDPHEIFIRSRMTDVIGAVKRKTGKVLASFREIPVICLDEAKRLSEILSERGIGGILVIGDPNKSVLEAPVGIDRIGMVVVGGLNPISALVELGIPTENKAMSILYEYSKLVLFKDAIKKL